MFPLPLAYVVYTHSCLDTDGSPPSMPKESKEQFGLKTTMGRAGQPVEVATCFVFLASADSSYIRFVPRYTPSIGLSLRFHS